MNLAGLIRQHAFGRAQNTALVCAGKSMNYDELWRRICALAGRLQKSGVLPGQRVGVALSDHPGYITSYFALAAIGAVVVPIDRRWSRPQQTDVVEAFNVQLLLHDVDTDPLPDVKALACPPDGFRDVAVELTLPDLDDQDWLVSLSSGSTGQPKGALVTHGQMHARFVAQWVSLGLSSANRFALVTPLHYGAGRSFAMSVLSAGATLVMLPPPMTPDQMVQAITQARADVTFLVPTLMRRCIELGGSDRLLPTLRQLIISDDAFFADEVSAFQARLCPALAGYYASSEGGGISVLQPGDFSTRGDTVGQAAYGVEIELVDDTDTPVQPDEIGRIRYRGPGVTQRALDETGKPEPNMEGWFYPGDLGSRSGDGYLTLRGRAQDMIVRGGVNIYPALIEAVLMALDGVNEVAVVGVPSTSHGEQVLAFVVGSVTIDALVSHCESQLAPYTQPDIRRVPELPRTPAGKIDKKALRIVQ